VKRVTLNAMARRLGYVVPPGAGDVVALGFRDGERFAFTIDRHGVTGLWPQDTTGKAVIQMSDDPKEPEKDKDPDSPKEPEDERGKDPQAP
jgi:hypothetical protein